MRRMRYVSLYFQYPSFLKSLKISVACSRVLAICKWSAASFTNFSNRSFAHIVSCLCHVLRHRAFMGNGCANTGEHTGQRKRTAEKNQRLYSFRGFKFYYNILLCHKADLCLSHPTPACSLALQSSIPDFRRLVSNISKNSLKKGCLPILALPGCF